MLTKKPTPAGLVAVTFTMPRLEGVTGLNLAGEFNGWNPTAHPLTQAEDGTWSVTVELEAGRHYAYRYLSNTGEWLNDWQADAYQPNEHGTDNSIVITALPAEFFAPAEAPAAPVTEAEGEASKPKKKSAPKKKAAEAEAGAEPKPKKTATRKKKTDA